MKVIIVRHAETEWNRKNIIHGVSDVPLSVRGKKQTKMLAAKLKGEKIDKIISSDLKRCRQTAGIINKVLRAPLSYDKRLREVNHGVYEGKPAGSRNRARRKSGSTYHLWRPEGGQSYTDKYRELAPLAKGLKKKYKGNILLVTHGAAARILIILLLGRRMKNMRYSLRHSNTAVTIIEINKSRARAVKINDTSHLK